jgi:adenine/guanine phosphoribosyltransferase-like PRPP-binding protein
LEKLKAELVSIQFLIELEFLHGREQLPTLVHTHSMIQF